MHLLAGGLHKVQLPGALLLRVYEVTKSWRGCEATVARWLLSCLVNRRGSFLCQVPRPDGRIIGGFGLITSFLFSCPDVFVEPSSAQVTFPETFVCVPLKLKNPNSISHERPLTRGRIGSPGQLPLTMR